MGRQFKPGQLQTGSLYNISSSYAVTASFALNGGGTTINTGSFVTTSSFNAFTASYTTGSFTGSFTGDGSQLTGIVSSKWTGSNPISRQGDVEITGSLRVQGSITGSLFGTASWAQNAVTASYSLYAVSASYEINYETSSSYAETASIAGFASTASYVLNAVSSSFATSASYAPDTTFPYSGSALITGSLGVTGSYSSRMVSPSSYLWQTHFSGERFDSTTLQGKVYIKTNYPFVEDFYIGKNNGSANNDTSTSAGIHYSHTGQFTVRNTQTSGFYGVTLNADQNLEQRVGIDTGRNSFGFGWSLRNFTNSTDYINFAHNSSRVGIGWNDKTTSLLAATLDVKATGSLSTDIAFRVRNSANTQNLMSITGDGRVAIGLNAQILGTTDAYKNVVIGGGAKDISAAGVTENAVAFGYNAVSNNGGTAIGANTSITGIQGVAVGAGAIAGIGCTAIGTSAQADGTSGYQALAIGFGARASALLSGIIAVGQSSYTNALGQTLAFCVDPSGANSQTMLLTNKANLVFRNSTQLTSGTHWDTTATNTLTIHSGSIPATTVSGAFQMYAATGSLTNNARPHFRTGNGTVVWLGDESRLFNVTASNMRVGVTSSLALFTSQNITANIGVTTIYAFSTASYDGAFIDYTARSGSNARAGQIMGIWSGSAVNFTETTTTDFGSTTGLTFGMSVSASSMIVSASAATAAWTVKTIIRSI